MSKLDAYEIRARQAPAYVVIAPIVLLVFMILPEAQSWKGIISTGAGSIAFGALLAYLARGPGAQKQARLFAMWGGTPTTELLLHRDSRLNPETRRRYHKYLASAKAANVVLLDAAEEEADPGRARVLAESAVDWLRKKRQSKTAYPRVRQELMAYGFARNLWGMKPIGIALSVATGLLEVGLAVGDVPAVHASKILLLGAAALSSGLGFVWIWAVTPSWVRVHAEAYARALLETCEASTSTKTKSA